MLAPRLAIFDFDGTLADSFPWFRDVLNSVADRFDFRRVSGEAEVERLRGMDARAIMSELGVPAWKLPMIARHMRRLAAEDAEAIPLFAGAAEALDHIASHGIVIAVVSSNAEANIRRVLGPGPAGLVDHFACGAALFGKAGKFRQVLKAFRIPAEEALGIGDEVRDIEAARSLGIPFAAVTWGYATPAALAAAKPDMMVNSFSELALRLTEPG
jgi:phosphoglycolate phosphatase